MESTFSNVAVDQRITKVREVVASVIKGQSNVVDLLLTAMLAEGHVLLEGVPGVAKTLTARLLARLTDARFIRVQFTSDILPSDVLGTNVFNAQSASFDFHPGPVFADIVLVDEINRAPAKTQSALFEVMEERQATIDGKCYPMSNLYTIVATQNPIDQEGTYRLPEAQMDRFLFKITVGYPDAEAEAAVLRAHNANQHLTRLDGVEPILSQDDVLELRRMAHDVAVDDKILDYIVAIAQASRNHPAIHVGASPRASIAFLSASKALALLNGRSFVIPEDVKALAQVVLCHRISLTADAEMDGLSVASVIADLVSKVEVPK